MWVLEQLTTDAAGKARQGGEGGAGEGEGAISVPVAGC